MYKIQNTSISIPLGSFCITGHLY